MYYHFGYQAHYSPNKQNGAVTIVIITLDLYQFLDLKWELSYLN